MFKKYNRIIAFSVLLLMICFNCIIASAVVELPEKYPFQYHAKVKFDSAIEHQTIQGFGGFGFRDVNWSNSSRWWTDSWGNTVLNDLGFSITRNEWYPPQIEGEGQDTNWEVQKPVIQKFHDLAKITGSPLKQVIAIWSPPANMKSNSSTKNGGKLLPEYYDDFGQWLVECIAAYKKAGVQLYAISPQNEPSAVVPYNSCFYTPKEYAEMIKVVGPIVKKAHPDVKIMGPEEMTCETWNWEKSYGKALMDDSEALKWIDIIVVHAYTIEYQSIPSDTNLEALQMADLYSNYKKAGKELWQTEVSSWPDHPSYGVTIAESIFNSLYHGNMSAWLYWSISGDGTSPGFYLMKQEEKGPLYYGVRHFSKYVRPGAKRIETTSTNDNLLAIGFKHKEDKKFTMVLINKAHVPMDVSLKGDLKINMKMEMTTETERGVDKGYISSSTKNLTLPPRAIVTLQGSYE